MINSERIHSPLPATGETLDYFDPERQSGVVSSKLELTNGEAPSVFRFRAAHEPKTWLGIKTQLAEYAHSGECHDIRVCRVLPSQRILSDAGKRALDITGALILLAVFSPVIIVVALLVAMTSAGPILFRQSRLGENGDEFTCLKFRTMVPDAEHQLTHRTELRDKYHSEFKIKDDPRITRVGKWLRKSSLDELPQLLNVLQGSMSLVGPRPIVPREIEKYGAYGPKLLSVRPGLTGVWQVCGRSDTTYNDRIIMDMFYVDRSSVSMDLKLLMSTVLSVLRCRGAY